MTSQVMVRKTMRLQSLGMNLKKIVPVVLFVGFTALTIEAIVRDGYTGWLRIAFANSSAGLLLVDLSIALSIIVAWMIKDARGRKSTLWPFLVLTFFLGSVGPLAYLVLRSISNRRTNYAEDLPHDGLVSSATSR